MLSTWSRTVAVHQHRIIGFLVWALTLGFTLVLAAKLSAAPDTAVSARTEAGPVSQMLLADFRHTGDPLALLFAILHAF